MNTLEQNKILNDRGFLNVLPTVADYAILLKIYREKFNLQDKDARAICGKFTYLAFAKCLSVKKYSIKYNVGKVKYLVSYHDGVKKHKDGSDFYDIKCFKNKIKLNKFVKELQSQNYRELRGWQTT